MSKEELIEFLRDNLNIQIELKTQNDYENKWAEITVRLYLDGEEISYDYVDLYLGG